MRQRERERDVSEGGEILHDGGGSGEERGSMSVMKSTQCVNRGKEGAKEGRKGGRDRGRPV